MINCFVKLTVGGSVHAVGGKGVRQANEILFLSSMNTISFVIKSQPILRFFLLTSFLVCQSSIRFIGSGHASFNSSSTSFKVSQLVLIIEMKISLTYP